MAQPRTRSRTFLSAIGVIAVAISPFLIYAAVQAISGEESTEVTTDPGSDTFLSPSPELTLTPSPTPEPTPALSPPPAPSEITVEVRNAGAPSGSASEVADDLRDGGFVVGDVTNHTGSSVSGVVVLYREDAARGDAVASFLDAGPSGPTTGDISTTADVVVLVGS